MVYEKRSARLTLFSKERDSGTSNNAVFRNVNDEFFKIHVPTDAVNVEIRAQFWTLDKDNQRTNSSNKSIMVVKANFIQGYPAFATRKGTSSVEDQTLFIAQKTSTDDDESVYLHTADTVVQRLDPSVSSDDSPFTVRLFMHELSSGRQIPFCSTETTVEDYETSIAIDANDAPEWYLSLRVDYDYDDPTYDVDTY